MSAACHQGDRTDLEIQTFLLAGSIQRDGEADGFNGRNIVMTTCYPADGIFPYREQLPCLMLLRRAVRGEEERFTLRMNVIDDEGESAGQATLEDVFPAGEKFLTLFGPIECEFPAPGDYRIDIMADEDKSATVYSYDLEVTNPPEE